MEPEEKRKLSNLDFLIESAKETIEYYEREINWKEESTEETNQDLKKLEDSEKEFSAEINVKNYIENRRNRWKKNLEESMKELVEDKKNLETVKTQLSQLEEVKRKLKK